MQHDEKIEIGMLIHYCGENPIIKLNNLVYPNTPIYQENQLIGKIDEIFGKIDEMYASVLLNREVRNIKNKIFFCEKKRLMKIEYLEENGKVTQKNNSNIKNQSSKNSFERVMSNNKSIKRKGKVNKNRQTKRNFAKKFKKNRKN
ncbi:H/ACA ribonucleoprotein complex subunit GAR1 [Dictyocoela muelleri]|nr:H/ACA ribonucleoprotein complex subunit GAR1 [Dictyocoela muelleri]